MCFRSDLALDLRAKDGELSVGQCTGRAEGEDGLEHRCPCGFLLKTDGSVLFRGLPQNK